MKRCKFFLRMMIVVVILNYSGKGQPSASAIYNSGGLNSVATFSGPRDFFSILLKYDDTVSVTLYDKPVQSYLQTVDKQN